MSNRKSSLLAIGLGCVLFLCSSVLQAGPVNINTADAATLAKELNGVGLKRAQAIVEYRQKHGPFKSADELALVKGIGAAAVAKNRELIRIEGAGKEESPERRCRHFRWRSRWPIRCLFVIGRWRCWLRSPGCDGASWSGCAARTLIWTPVRFESLRRPPNSIDAHCEPKHRSRAPVAARWHSQLN